MITVHQRGCTLRICSFDVCLYCLCYLREGYPKARPPLRREKVKNGSAGYPSRSPSSN